MRGRRARSTHKNKKNKGWKNNVGMVTCKTIPQITMNFHSFEREYLQYLSIEKGVSNHTISAYQSDIKQFIHFLKKAPISPKKITEFSSFLYEREFTAGSISRKISSIKSFCQFLFRENHIQFDVETLLIKPKKRKRLPKALSRKKIETLLEKKDNTFPDRDHAIMELIYACGLRISEVQKISWRWLF